MAKLRVAYFDCHSGISGDMILGALLDLGVDFKELQRELKSLGLKGFKLTSHSVRRGLISGIKVDVAVDSKGHHHSRNFTDIRKMIEDSGFTENVKANAIAVFKRIAHAESEVHRVPVNKIHFHEVGAVDSIIDIVGGSWALEQLKVDRIFSSPLNTGEGWVDCAHGTLPVPAPATLKLLKGVPCFSSGVKKELTTPTGAAMIGFYASSFKSLPEMTVLDSGYGAGGHLVKETPNMLRVILGEMADKAPENRMTMIETNIDDMNPELFDYVMEMLFKAGAVDVFFTPVHMKKNRPATKLSALVPTGKSAKAIGVILAETSTFGVRHYEVSRETLEREVHPLITPLGKLRVKLGYLDGEVVRMVPEYDDCKKLALQHKLPISKIFDEAQKLAREVCWPKKKV